LYASFFERRREEGGVEGTQKMSSDLNPRSRPSADKADAKEIFSPHDQLRPANAYLTEMSENGEDYCLILCTLPAGVVVPMHSHADRETFYVLSGEIDALRADRWEKLKPGDVFDVRDGAKHAWRNSSQAAVSILCVTTTKMGKFLQAISVSDEGSPAPADHARRFLELVKANGYWLASPDENAAVGLTVNWN
jgi:quercetin dioxygenase-like cupin family protein